jgi:hypothetical protein
MQSQTINVTSPLPDPTALLTAVGLEGPVIGVYARDPACVRQWLQHPA